MTAVNRSFVPNSDVETSVVGVLCVYNLVTLSLFPGSVDILLYSFRGSFHKSLNTLSFSFSLSFNIALSVGFALIVKSTTAPTQEPINTSKLRLINLGFAWKPIP
jgi:hypothetical protein